MILAQMFGGHEPPDDCTGWHPLLTKFYHRFKGKQWDAFGNGKVPGGRPMGGGCKAKKKPAAAKKKPAAKKKLAVKKKPAAKKKNKGKGKARKAGCWCPAQPTLYVQDSLQYTV